MFQTHQQKRYFFIAVLAIVVLVLVTVTSNPGGFNPSLNGAGKDVATDNVANKQAYDDALAAPDQVASSKLLKQLVNVEDLNQDANDLLQPNQKITVPDIPASQINLASKNDKAAIVQYLAEAGDGAQKFSAAITAAPSVFDDGGNIAKVAAAATNYQQQLATLPVPKSAVALHKAQLVALNEASQALTIPQNYSLDDLDQPWPSQMYGAYVVADAQMDVVQQQMSSLVKQYAITQDDLTQYAESKGGDGSAIQQGFSLINTAQAQFGGGVIFINWTEVFRYALEDLWSSLITHFLVGFVDLTVKRIEKNYVVANGLHYTDSLIAVQYAPDYIDKYIVSSDKGSTTDLDKKIIKILVPQIGGCGASSDQLKKIYQQQTRQYLGYDPTTLSIKDPDFEQKAARSMEFMATEDGRQMYYSQMAATAGATASQFAILEQTSGGSKNARNPQGTAVVTTQTKINSTVHALIQSSLDLGTGHTGSLAAKLAATALSSLVYNFAFPAGSTVLQDQTKCTSIASLKPVAGDGNTGSIIVKKQVRKAAKQGVAAGPWGDTLDIPGSSAQSPTTVDVQFKVTVSAANGQKISNVKFSDWPSFGITFVQCEDGSTTTIGGQSSSLSPDSKNIVLPQVTSTPIDITYCAKAGGPSGGQVQNFVTLDAGADLGSGDATINLK